MRKFLGYRYQVVKTIELELTEEIIKEIQAAVFTEFGATETSLPDAEQIMAIYESSWNPKGVSFTVYCFIQNYLNELVLEKGKTFEDDVDDAEYFTQVID